MIVINATEIRTPLNLDSKIKEEHSSVQTHGKATATMFAASAASGGSAAVDSSPVLTFTSLTATATATTPVKTTNNMVLFKEFPDLNFCSASKSVNESDITKIMLPVFDLVKKHPDALKLLQDVLKAGSVIVEFCSRENINASAVWVMSKRVIRIADTQLDTFDLLDSFIFELCNAYNPLLSDWKSPVYYETYIKNGTNSAELKKHAEEYAISIEKLEFLSDNLAAKIQKRGVVEYNWEKPKLDMPRNVLDLDGYFERVKIPNVSHNGLSHFENYQKNYYKLNVMHADHAMKIFISNQATLKKMNEDLEYSMKGKSEIKKLIDEAENRRAAIIADIKVFEDAESAYKLNFLEFTENLTSLVAIKKDELQEIIKIINENKKYMEVCEEVITVVKNRIKIITDRLDEKAYKNAMSLKKIAEECIEELNSIAKSRHKNLKNHNRLAEMEITYKELLKLFEGLSNASKNSVFANLLQYNKAFVQFSNIRTEITKLESQNQDATKQLQDFDEIDLWIAKGNDYKLKWQNLEKQSSASDQACPQPSTALSSVNVQQVQPKVGSTNFASPAPLISRSYDGVPEWINTVSFMFYNSYRSITTGGYSSSLRFPWPAEDNKESLKNK